MSQLFFKSNIPNNIHKIMKHYINSYCTNKTERTIVENCYNRPALESQLSLENIHLLCIPLAALLCFSLIILKLIV